MSVGKFTDKGIYSKLHGDDVELMLAAKDFIISTGNLDEKTGLYVFPTPTLVCKRAMDAT